MTNKVQKWKCKLGERIIIFFKRKISIMMRPKKIKQKLRGFKIAFFYRESLQIFESFTSNYCGAFAIKQVITLFLIYIR